MELTMQELIKVFETQHATTKTGILNKISNDHKAIIENSKRDIFHSSAFYHSVDELYMKMERKLEETILFSKLDEGWYYDYGLDYSGAFVSVIHANIYGIDDDGFVIYEVDQEFKLIELGTKLLSVEEYAKMYGVENGTVRQWIRRGKIRNAVKYGTEWKIPELTDPPKRGYTTAVYKWSDYLDDLPNEFYFLNDYDTAIFSQDEEDKTMFYISFYKKDDLLNDDDRVIRCNAQERQKVEIFMIAHPQISYLPNYGDGIMIDLISAYNNGADK